MIAAAGAAAILVPAAYAQHPGTGFIPGAAVCAQDATAGSRAEHHLLARALVLHERVSTLLRPLPRDVAVHIVDSIGAAAPGPRDLHSKCLVRLSAQVWYNTLPRLDADGGVWQGRGLTAALAAGAEWRRGPFSLIAHPMVFVTENRAFSPVPAPTVENDFRDPAWGREIDLPYRFGDEPYVRLLPGETAIRVDWKALGAGLTAASQHWGPMHRFPLLIGTESEGYPRAFIEIRNQRVGQADVTAQWQMGVLESSPYVALAPGDRSRVASALMASIRFDALELGGGRFFHVRKTPGAISLATATLPFSGLLKNRSRDLDIGGQNQLASVFFRVAPVGQGIEVYGELLREDHNADTRDLILEPDHESAFALGLRRSWSAVETGRLTVLMVEYANARISHLARVRPQPPLYTHSTLVEGHTFRGQAIGSHALVGGGGTTFAWSRFDETDSHDLSFTIERRLQNTEGGTWSGEMEGAYVFHGGSARTLGSATLGAFLELRIGYGRESASAIGVSFFAIH